MIYVLSIYDHKYWYAIQVTPQARCVLDNVEVETMKDISIIMNRNIDNDSHDLDNTYPSPSNHDEDMHDEEKYYDEPLDEDLDESDWLNLFVEIWA